MGLFDARSANTSQTVPPSEAGTTNNAVLILTATHNTTPSQGKDPPRKTKNKEGVRCYEHENEDGKPSHVLLGGRGPNNTRNTPTACMCRIQTNTNRDDKCWRGGGRACSPRKHDGSLDEEHDNDNITRQNARFAAVSAGWCLGYAKPSTWRRRPPSRLKRISIANGHRSTHKLEEGRRRDGMQRRQRRKHPQSVTEARHYGGRSIALEAHRSMLTPQLKTEQARRRRRARSCPHTKLCTKQPHRQHNPLTGMLDAIGSDGNDHTSEHACRIASAGGSTGPAEEWRKPRNPEA